MQKLQAPANNLKSERNHTLDVLKGIAILFVIITHYEWTNGQRLAYGFPFWVDMAVAVFMAISGFVNSRSFEKHGISSFEQAYQIKDIVKKAIRYTVPFLITYVLELIYFAAFETPKNPEETFFGFFNGGFGQGSYYYPMLMQLIFLFPVIYFVIRRYDFRGLLGCFAANGLYEILQRAFGCSDTNYRFLILRYLFIISFGCYLAIGRRKIKRPEMLLAFLIGTAFIIVYAYLQVPPRIIIYWTRTSFLAVLYLVPFLIFLFQKQMHSKLLELLGRSSYCIFLVQMFYYISKAPYLPYHFTANPFLRVLANIIICCIAGVIFQKIVDWIIGKIMQNFQ